MIYFANIQQTGSLEFNHKESLKISAIHSLLLV